MRSSDCFYCEFDQGPLKGRHEKCQTCEKASNFKRKIRMTPSMLGRWEDKQQFEREFLSNVEPFDEKTARMVLDDICEFVSFRPNGEQLIISLDKFNLIRKKYLDNKKEN